MKILAPRPVAAVVVLGCALAVSSTARADEPDPWWGPDKALHFGASAAIAGGAYGVSTAIFDAVPPRAAFAAGVALSAGVAKELLDAAGLGDPSFKDLTWDVIGTAVGVAIGVSIDLATRPKHALAR